ncbi:glycosyltransferase family 4 protein [Candidatus Bipolaricaulota bacterium]|nr:glycosyltransferase family 4 protein [Candidatus Bipolaricaulota bacterium]
MKIGINLLFLLPGIVGGTETYALSLLRALGQIDRQNEYMVFLNRESAELQLPPQSNFEAVICPVSAKIRAVRYLWEQFVLPFQARTYRLDLLHSLGYVQPLRLPCKSVVTVPDLNFHNLCDFLPLVRRTVLRFFVSQSARRADHVLTISQASRNQIISILGVPAQKVTVAHLAAKETRARPVSFDVLRQKLHVQKPYILALSSLSPHKNMRRLIEAFAIIRERGFVEERLILAGHPPRGKSSLDELVSRKSLGNCVRFTGYVSDEALASLYTHAELFVFPSLYEGFGIPVLEAFTYGTPVALSNATSLPEVAGDAASYFDPRNTEEIAGTIIHMLQDKALQARLVLKGKERARLFTWERSARRTLETYERVIRNCG